MRTRRNMVLGIAAVALAVTACGMAANHSAGIASNQSGGMPGVHVARANALSAPMSTSVTNMEDLAGVKRHASWVAGYFAPVQRPQMVLAERDLAEVKRGIESSAAQQPGSR